MTTRLHRAAIALAKTGMAILPCVARGKVPATPHGVKDATIDAATIDAWWQECPEANIGIACGTVSGVFVVDIDGDNGEASMRKLEAEHGALPPTVEVITGNGRHCYFRLGEPIGNSVGRIGPGVDTRGHGGYVLAPPSVHPSGRRYEWSVDTATEFADAPDWLRELISTKARPKSAVGLHNIVAGTVTEGRRNDTLARMAGCLLRHYVEPPMALALVDAFNRANCSPPLPDAEVIRTVESIWTAEQRRRNFS